MVSLPSAVASAMAALQPWPVTTTRPPLHYLPLDQLAAVRARASDASPNATASQCLPVSPQDLLRELPVRNDHATVAVGLLYLNHGGTDECHALVTPLSWPDETPFGAGPPVPDSPAAAHATFAHCLVHRWEGSHRGEFGTAGYANAHYWGKACRADGRRDAALCARIRRAIEAELLSPGDGAASGDGDSEAAPAPALAAAAWFREWIGEALPDPEDWEPRALTELCRRLEARPEDPLAAFCARACRIESRVLLEDCWAKAGYTL